MLLRDTADGLEVFMLRRNNALVFAAGNYVFPGGRVDERDGGGLDGFMIAAVRECFEECGVLLATDATGTMIEDGHPALAERLAVEHGDVDLRELVARHSLQLATDQLVFCAHWITPKGEPRRYDTRFFVMASPPGQTWQHDDNEAVASQWIRPADGVAAYERGEMRLMPPTIDRLRWLSGFGDVASALADARTVGTPPVILPKGVFAEDGRLLQLLLPGDDGYDALPD